MKKYGLHILAGLMTIVTFFSVLYLCTHGSMPPDKVTEYYQLKAKTDAETKDGAEAELMAMLLSGQAPVAAEEVMEEAVPVLETSPLSWRLALVSAGIMIMLIYFGCSKEYNRNRGFIWTAILAAPLGIIGARLFYCLPNISFYLHDIQSPLAMLKMWEGGLSLMGALAGITLACVLASKITGQKALQLLNELWGSLLLLVVAAFDGLFRADQAWGPEIGVLPIFSTNIDGREFLDTASLTMLLICIIFFVLDRLSHRNKLPKDRRFLYAAFLYGCLMVPMESLRRDGHMLLGFVHVEMFYAMLIFLPAGLALARKNRRIPLMIATVLLAGIIIGLEFMLDRSSIKDWLLYIVYILCMGAYVFVGLKWASTPCKQAESMT